VYAIVYVDGMTIGEAVKGLDERDKGRSRGCLTNGEGEKKGLVSTLYSGISRVPQNVEKSKTHV
jgi:hypothetical protein